MFILLTDKKGLPFRLSFIIFCLNLHLKLLTAKHHHHHHHGFFQYARQPAKGHWESGYRRGNHEHVIERHEQGAAHSFKSKVKWGDKHGGHGEHHFEFNHKGTGEEGPKKYHQPKQHYNQGHGHWASVSASASAPHPVRMRKKIVHQRRFFPETRYPYQTEYPDQRKYQFSGQYHQRQPPLLTDKYLERKPLDFEPIRR